MLAVFCQKFRCCALLLFKEPSGQEALFRCTHKGAFFPKSSVGSWNYQCELVAIARAQWTSVYSDSDSQEPDSIPHTAQEAHKKASELHTRCLSGKAHMIVRYVKQHSRDVDAAAVLAGVARCQSSLAEDHISVLLPCTMFSDICLAAWG